MALGTCLADLLQRKLISQQRHDELRPRYDELVAQFEPRYGRAAAESMATDKVLQLAEHDAIEKKRVALLQARAQGQWLLDMRKGLPDGAPLPRKRAEQFIVDMDGHRRSIEIQAQQMNGHLLEIHRRNVAGVVRHKSDLEDVLRELHGIDTGSVNAKEIAESWRQSAEWLRSRFNAAGGHIPKLDEWALPQRHDMRAVREAGFPAWRDALLGKDGVPGLLDRAKMIDYDTLEPMTDAKLELMLQDTWHAIATDGWSRNTPGAIRAGSKANSRADHRILHFAGPDEWLAYATKFGGYGEDAGGAAVFDAMLSHIKGMARDIAAMEKMGPNPNATLRFMQDSVQQTTETALLTGRAGRRASDEANMAKGQMQRLYDEYTGANNKPENRRLALGFSIFRSQQSAAKLGSAVLSIGGDYGTMIHTSRFDGIPAAKVMGTYVSLLNPANAADRAQAARHVLMAEQWAEGHAGQWRVLGEELAQEQARRVANGVLRASGLIAHTDIGRMAFGMEMVAALTHARERSFGNLDPALQGLLQRYGIGEARWDAMRVIAPDSYKGTDWLYPETVAKQDQALADDYMRMIVTEADYAVPVPDLRTRASINANLPKGTWRGELIRSGFLFKGFPLTIINMHGRRMLEQGTKGWAGLGSLLLWRYGLSVLGLTTLGGALSLQMKDLARGQDPQPMNSGKFWGAAMVQGGGLSIYGDLLYASQNRFGGGMLETLVGPGGEFLENTGGAVGGNTLAAIDGDPKTKTRWKKDAARLVLSETPGLSLWYARGFIDRTFGDLVNEWAYGQDIGQHYRNLNQYARQRGTQYYAPPGQGLGGMRAPDFANALGEPADAASSDDLGKLN